tara:strand:- start:999 stop:1430 length:432 start_codon:yes stop_codon:yes gene_type:complete
MEHTLTQQAKYRKVRRIMKKMGLSKKDALIFLHLMTTNENFRGFKGKKRAFLLAKKQGISIGDAMNEVAKRRAERKANNALDNLTGASQTIAELETQELEEKFSDFDGGDFIKKNGKVLIVVGLTAFLLFTKMGKKIVKDMIG